MSTFYSKLASPIDIMQLMQPNWLWWGLFPIHKREDRTCKTLDKDKKNYLGFQEQLTCLNNLTQPTLCHQLLQQEVTGHINWCFSLIKIHGTTFCWCRNQLSHALVLLRRLWQWYIYALEYINQEVNLGNRNYPLDGILYDSCSNVITAIDSVLNVMDGKRSKKTGYWRLASARALPSLPGLARTVLWTVERLPALPSITISDSH
jgi:hypothetical protein